MKLSRLILPAIAIGGVVWLCISMNRDAHLSAKESGQRALMREAYILIEAHHKERGTYPDTLSELPLTFPDGGSRDMIKDIHYVPRSDSYFLRSRGYKSDLIIEYGTEAESPSGSGHSA